MCSSTCIASLEEYEAGLELYQQVFGELQMTKEELKGIKELRYLLANNVEAGMFMMIDRVFTVKEISVAGIGPSDFEFKVRARAVSLRSGRMESFESGFDINFFDAVETVMNIFTETKRAIVKFSNGALNEGLVSKSAIELAEENYNKS